MMTRPAQTTQQSERVSDFETGWPILFCAWAVAVISTLCALFIGEIMGLLPCNLCWYQRIFMFPLALFLGIAAYRNDLGCKVYAIPMSLIGGAIAAFHSLLYAGVIPQEIEPCGSGPSCSGAAMVIFGSVPIPYLSVGAFAAISVLLLLADSRRAK